MNKLLWLLCFISISANAATASDCITVYKKLISKNNISNPLSLYYIHDKQENAFTDGRAIYITSGMAKKLNVQQLAFVLGHEIGHSKSKSNHSSYLNEYNADIDGALLSQKAGYNPCKGKDFFLKYLNASTQEHPRSIDRYNKIKCN